MNSTARSLPFVAYLSPLVGLLTGYGATLLETQFAPVGLFPLIVGVATGLGVVASMRLAACACRRGHVAAAVAAALCCAATMHYASYRTVQAAAELESQKFMQATMTMPQAKFNNPPMPIADFREFITKQFRQGRPLGANLIRGAWLMVWWVVDGLLILVGAAATAFYLSAPPTPPLVQLAEGPSE